MKRKKEIKNSRELMKVFAEFQPDADENQNHEGAAESHSQAQRNALSLGVWPQPDGENAH